MSQHLDYSPTIIGGMLMASSLFAYVFYRVVRPPLAGGMTPKKFMRYCWIGIIGGALIIVGQFFFPHIP